MNEKKILGNTVSVNTRRDAHGGSDAAALLIEILLGAMYASDQSANIAALADELGVTIPAQPDIPVVPDEPEQPAVTLSGISATYSGGDVAAGTAVSDLVGIEVIGHYSDGTSKPVTGYTVSGTITDGDNAITVSYGGKTATINVVGVAESSGGGIVDMTSALQHASANNVGYYADSGDTAYSDSRFPAATNVKTILSDKVFDTDTSLKITVKPSNNFFMCMLFTSTTLDAERKITATDTDDLFFHIKSSNDVFAYGWTTAAQTFTYTVRAGYKFGIVAHPSCAVHEVPISVEVIG